MPTTFVVIIVVLLAALVGLVLGRASSRPTPLAVRAHDVRDAQETAVMETRLAASVAEAAAAKEETAALKRELASQPEQPVLDTGETDALRAELVNARDRERAQTAQLMASAQEVTALKRSSENAHAEVESTTAKYETLRSDLADAQARLIELVNEREALLEGGGGAAALRRKVESLLATQETALRRAAQLEAELATARRRETPLHEVSTDPTGPALLAVAPGVASTTNGHAPSRAPLTPDRDLGELPEVDGSSVATRPPPLRHGLEGDEPEIDLVS